MSNFDERLKKKEKEVDIFFASPKGQYICLGLLVLGIIGGIIGIFF
jgi:hypothetical protein